MWTAPRASCLMVLSKVYGLAISIGFSNVYGFMCTILIGLSNALGTVCATVIVLFPMFWAMCAPFLLVLPMFWEPRVLVLLVFSNVSVAVCAAFVGFPVFPIVACFWDCGGKHDVAVLGLCV